MRIPVLLCALSLIITGCAESADEPVTVPATSTTSVSSTSTTQIPPTSTATTTTAPADEAFSLTDLETQVNEEWPTSPIASMWSLTGDWTCELETGAPPAMGSVARCTPSEIPSDSQFPILTVLVLDGAGTQAVAQAGIVYPVLDPETIIEEFGSGHLCRDILADGLALKQQLATPELQYFGALLYWFMDGRPERMDADTNGVPCETLFPAPVVETVWAGGWFEG